MSRFIRVQWYFFIYAACVFSMIYPNKSFAFACRIADQVVLTADQGNARSYTSIKNSFKTGNVINFDLSLGYFLLSDPTPYLKLSLKEFERDSIFFDRTTTFRKIDVFGDVIFANGVKWSSNSFEISGGEGFLSISRYYMSDWHGSLSVSISSEVTYTAILNCIGASEELDSVRRQLLSIPEIEVRTLPRTEDLIKDLD